MNIDVTVLQPSLQLEPGGIERSGNQSALSVNHAVVELKIRFVGKRIDDELACIGRRIPKSQTGVGDQQPAAASSAA